MPFIPHTEDELSAMLGTIGVSSVEDLFDEIPAELTGVSIDKVPDGMKTECFNLSFLA